MTDTWIDPWNWANNPSREPVKFCTTPAEMRAEMYRMRRHDPALDHLLRGAEFRGMSAEDTYSIVAYALLGALRDTQQRLRNTQQRLFEHINTTPGAVPVRTLKFDPRGPGDQFDLEGRN